MPLEVPVAPPFAQKGAVGVEDLYAVIFVVADENFAVRRDGNPRRLLELTVARPVRAEGFHEFSIASENGNAVVAPLRDVQVAIGSKGQLIGFVQLPVAAAVSPEMADVSAVFIS